MAGDIPINPYEDWAQQGRLEFDKMKYEGPITYLHPCYINFKLILEDDGKIDVAATKANIADFRDAAVENSKTRDADQLFLLDELALNMLLRLENALDAGGPVERYRRFFIFRERDHAYCDSEEWFDVLNVSASFPATAEFIASARPKGDGIAAIEGAFAGPPPEDRPVLTGIIDDFFGFANERFCFRDADGRLRTRFERLWIQQTPNSYTSVMDEAHPPIFMGPTLYAEDINELFDASKSGDHTHEPSVYDAVYLGGQLPFIGVNAPVYLSSYAEIQTLGERRDISEDLAKILELFLPGGGFDYARLSDLESSASGDPFAFFRAGGSIGSILKEPDIRLANQFGFTHGTHMLDCAAGLSPDDERAENAPILAVQLPPLATGDTTGVRLEHAMIAGLQRLLNWADDWPGGPANIVINLSFVLNAGPKNGEGFVEEEFRRLLDLRNEQVDPTSGKNMETTLVLPSGNAFRAKLSGKMNLPSKDDAKTVDWRIRPSDQSSNYLELWYKTDAEIQLEVTTPSGVVWTIDETAEIVDLEIGGILIGRAYFSAQRSGLKNITLALLPTLNHDSAERTAEAGAYQMKATNVGAIEVDLSLDVQRDDTPRNYREIGSQSYLDDPKSYLVDPETKVRNLPSVESTITREGTLSSMATDNPLREITGMQLVGGAFDNGGALGPVTLYSGSGPTLRTRLIPDLSAVSDESRHTFGRLASGTFSGSTAIISGTSVAAALVTRKLVEDRNGFGDPLVWEPVDPEYQNRLGGFTLAYEELPDRPARRMPAP